MVGNRKAALKVPDAVGKICARHVPLLPNLSGLGLFRRGQTGAGVSGLAQRQLYARLAAGHRKSGCAL